MSRPLLALAILLFLNFVSIQSTSPQCECVPQTDCEAIAAASQVIMAQINSRTSEGSQYSYKIKVQKVYKGDLKDGQKLEIYSDQECLKLKTDQKYLLSLVSDGKDWDVPHCGFHTQSNKVSDETMKTLSNISSCPANCSEIMCPLLECEQMVTDPGTCCPRCARECNTSTGMYSSGQHWNSSLCDSCTCNDGNIECVMMNCPVCQSNPIYTEGQCCPMCENCPALLCQIHCPDGFKVNQTTGCEVCDCMDCSNVQCPKLNCNSKDTIQIAGQCCPECKMVCGTSDNCKPLQNCHQWYIPENQCCPVCLVMNGN